MPPSRSHIRAAIEAYLVRHPDEQPRLDALLAALGRSDSPTPRGTFPGHASCSALLKKPANASALIYNDAGQYLLHLRDNIPGIWEPGAWSLLGGGREPEDRSLDDTVHRELHEEAGLSLPELEPYAIEEAPTGGGSTVDIAIYAGRWNGDPGELALTEGVMLAWFTPRSSPACASAQRRSTWCSVTRRTRPLHQRARDPTPTSPGAAPIGRRVAHRRRRCRTSSECTSTWKTNEGTCCSDSDTPTQPTPPPRTTFSTATANVRAPSPAS